MSLFNKWFNIKSSTEIKPFILMYHRIIDKPQDGPFPVQPGMYVSTQNFEKNIVYLKNNFNIIRLEQLLDKIYQGQPLYNHCAITFDDGWEDNYLYAFPILIKHHIPASFFLSTDYIGTNKWFWFDEIAFFILNVERNKQIEIFKRNKLYNDLTSFLSKKRRNQLDTLTKVVFDIKNSISTYEKKILMLDVCEINRKYGKSSKVMLDWNQVISMKSSGLADIYSHSHTHENLDQCSHQYVFEDIKQSLDEISKYLHQSGAKIFCYPSGKNNEITSLVLKKLGFDYAVTTERGFVEKNNMYAIKRIGIHNDISQKVINSLR